MLVAGHKLIYVNAFCGTKVSEWRTQFVTICDDDESVWGVVYDPTTAELIEHRPPDLLSSRKHCGINKLGSVASTG